MYNYHLSQFSSVLFKIYALGKARKCPTWPQKFPHLCHWNTFKVGLINDGPFSSSVKCFLFHSSDWWCDILPWFCACTKCLKLLNTSELPRPKPQLMIAMHCLPAQSSLDFGLSRTVHTGGSSMVMPNIDKWASHSHFCSNFIISVGMMV